MTDIKEAFKLLVTLLALSLLVLLCSCGTRKVQKSVNKESSTTEQTTTEKKDIEVEKETQKESNVKKTETITVDDKNQETTKETVYEPIDNTKPSSIIDPDGKETKLNNSKKTTKETTKNNNSKTETKKESSEEIKEKAKEALRLKTESENKAIAEAKRQADINNTDRKSNPLLPLLWLLIPLGGYLIWKFKYKLIGL